MGRANDAARVAVATLNSGTGIRVRGHPVRGRGLVWTMSIRTPSGSAAKNLGGVEVAGWNAAELVARGDALPCCLAFCLCAAITMPAIGTLAIPLALVACLALGRLTWQSLAAPASAPSAS
jgi:hypothetical protein